MAPFINKQNAAELAKRKHARWLEAQAAAKVQPQQPQPQQQPASPVLGLSLTDARDEYQRLLKLQSECTDPKGCDAYSRSAQRMFQIWQVLSKTPNPGQLRPSEPSRRQQAPSLEPLACGPGTATGSVQTQPAIVETPQSAQPANPQGDSAK
jgi:hypothetical protein